MKHGFLRRVVRLCLVMMVALTVAAIVKSPLDAGTLGVLMGGWCGELLLTLLKRRWEIEDKRDQKEEEIKDDET